MVKSKAADYFSPHQLGVACPGGAETMIHSLCACVDHHWNNDDFVVLKVDLRNAFHNLDKPYWTNATPISLSSFPGHHGAMVITQNFGIQWAVCHPPQECSKVIHLAPFYSLSLFILSSSELRMHASPCCSTNGTWTMVLWLGPRLALIRPYLS